VIIYREPKLWCWLTSCHSRAGYSRCRTQLVIVHSSLLLPLLLLLLQGLGPGRRRHLTKPPRFQ